MKKIISILVLMLILLFSFGCKKNEDVSLPARINFFDIRPQVIGEDETAWITISVSNLGDRTALIKSLADYGLTNPVITSTTGNPVYIEYAPPDIDSNSSLQVTITIMVMDLQGQELDRVEGRITVED